ATTIIGEKPDSVIIATGVVPFLPSIPGIKRRNVVTANDVLSGKVEVGKRVAIIGGELIGCETADYLAAKGKKVTVLRRGKEVAVDVGPSQRGPLLERLQKSGVVFLTEVKYEEITSKGLVITDNKGEKQVIRADSIVIAAGSKSNNALENELKGKVPSVYSIGDCVEPRKIVNAIVEGEKVGREI
ncbi:MAG: FAD-dependent oxidoreductase, partial [Dehalococcoidia bacterium]|nr:FAD-dependent oxidoreductase [Dehalococcoidia bacterium]